jgi:ribonuclease J
MKFKIHRGTKEIGGSCVEVWTENTRILLDFGMPLVNADKTQFDSRKLNNLTVSELIEQGILHDIKGLYDDSEKPIDGVLISHAHQDHYGLSNYIRKSVKFYLGEATHSLIKINNIFTPQELVLNNTVYFQREVPFQIGDFTITAYWADHSAFDAYSFLIEGDGKRFFYSADFRSHGRKDKVFRWFLHNAPQNVDYLLMEGTTLGRKNDERFKTEIEIQEELEQLFKQSDKINLIYTSGQNIDRIVSIYKACVSAGKTMVVDVYVAYVLKALSKFGKIPYPSVGYPNIKVIFTKYTSDRLENKGNVKILYKFKDYKISKDEISNEPEKIVMLVRPGMEVDLKNIDNIEGGNIIYSMWEGYLESLATKKLIDYLVNRDFIMCSIHTSGHADTEALKKMVNALNPKFIVPIHTFYAGDYKNHFSQAVVELNDGEEREI